ncbi:MAG TPA: carboxylesterase family protein, partial [Terriglobales bacterium]|nr:carboxylesterase family protein [Terriglobales bacterium]
EATHDLVFRTPSRKFAAAHRGRTHVYEFGWRSPACEGELGACHAVELPFVFNTLPCCTGPDGLVGENPPVSLAQTIHQMWIDFASNGQAPWPEYSDSTRQVFALEAGTWAHELPFPAERYLG